MKKDISNIKANLDALVKEYNRVSFIEDDPICIPHRYANKQDREIAGFFAAVFAWGIRTTIINKSIELMQLMDDAPFDFITTHQETDLKKLLHFKHRTFNATDLLHFIRFLKHHYTEGHKQFNSSEISLESAFTHSMGKGDATVENGLIGFNHYFFSLEDSPPRTRKHIPSPLNNSSCKRLNMYLRWMVRSDKAGVDFGHWKNIKPSQLICPLDVHVQRVATRLGLIQSEKSDWKTAIELTDALKQFDPKDPVKYDIGLFSMGINSGKVEGGIVENLRSGKVERI